MAGFREAFIYRFNKLTPFLPHKVLTRLTGQNLILPVYHLVSDRDVTHVKHLYAYKTVQQFKRDLEYLLRYYEPINLSDLIDFTEGYELKKPSFLLTFDDGLREFGDVVAPILKQKGVPAICFLNNAFIGNKALFFRYKVSLLIEHLLANQGAESVQRAIDLIPERTTEDRLPEVLLGFNHTNEGLIDQIASTLEIDFTQYLADEKPYLDAYEIEKLIESGFNFGAHSLHHPEYFLLSLSQQLEQTTQSILGLTKMYPSQPMTFAFPFTDHQVSNAFFEELRRQIPDLKLTFGSAGQKKDLVMGHLQRIPMEMRDLSAKEIIQTELLYYLAKAPFGKNTLVRK